MRWYHHTFVISASMIGLSCASTNDRQEELAKQRQAVWNGTRIPATPDAVGIVHTTMMNPSNTASMNFGSGIALNNRWVLTAKHVRERAGIDFENETKRIKVDFGAADYDVDKVVILGNGPLNRNDRKYDLEAYHTKTPMNINTSTTGWRTQIFQGTTDEILALSSVLCWGYGEGGADGSANILRFAQLFPRDKTLTAVMKGESPDPITLKKPINFFTPPNSLNMQVAQGDSGGPCFSSADNKLVGIIRATELGADPSPTGVITSVAAYTGLQREMNRLAMVEPERAEFGDIDFDGNPDLMMLVAKDDGLGGKFADLQIQLSNASVWPLTDGFVDLDDLNLLGIRVPASALTTAVATLGDFNGNGASDVLAFVGNTPFYYDGQSGLVPIVHTDLSDTCLLDFTKCLPFFTPKATAYSRMRTMDFNQDGYEDVEAITSAGLVDTYYGSEHGLVSGATMDGFPSADGNDGKFVTVSGQGYGTIDKATVSFEITVDGSSQSDVRIEVFDGDLGGLSDRAGDGSTRTCYRLSSHPGQGDTVAEVIGEITTDRSYKDNEWTSIYSGPLHSTALSNGNYFYRLDVYLAKDCSKGADSAVNAINTFKVRSTGMISLLFGEFSLVGRDSAGTYAPATLPSDPQMSDTTYDGKFDVWPFVGAAGDEVVVRDADFDKTSKGGDALGANDIIFYDVSYPTLGSTEALALHNASPSGNYDVLANATTIEEHTIPMPPDVDPAYLWHIHLENVGAVNNVHMWVPEGSPATYQTFASPADRFLSVSAARTTPIWQGQTATAAAWLPIVLGTANSSGVPDGGSQVIRTLSALNTTLAGQSGALYERLAAALATAKLNQLKGFTIGERLDTAYVYGTTSLVADVLASADAALRDRKDLSDPAAVSRIVTLLSAVNLGQVSYRGVRGGFPADPNGDPDGDGIATVLDNCPTLANATQQDTDGDGLGDACACAGLSGQPGIQANIKLKYKNGMLAPNDNHIKPHFQLVNAGSVDLELKDVTVRYWYTNENTRAQQFWVDFAQIGNANVTGRFARPYMLRAGSNSYLEVGFAQAAGVLHPGQSTGEIQTRFNNTDWSNFNETDDYSYDGSKVAYADWSKMTVYVRGNLVWGKEPLPGYCAGGPFTLGQSFRVDYAVGDSGQSQDNHLKPHLKITNLGQGDVPLQELTARYWYTVDSQSCEQAWLDYAALGSQNVRVRAVVRGMPVAGADRYLEISFPASAGTLIAGANTGDIFARLNKKNWSNYDETNDYSYNGAQTTMAPTDRVTLYRNGALVWGVEP